MSLACELSVAVVARRASHLTIARGVCASSSRQLKRSPSGRLVDLRQPLNDRYLEGLVLRELEQAAWRDVRDDAVELRC